jgi:hypothetical protein
VSADFVPLSLFHFSFSLVFSTMFSVIDAGPSNNFSGVYDSDIIGSFSLPS